MSRRLLTTGLIVAALLAGRVTAKPPDLPLPQNDILAPLTRPVPREATPYVFPQAAEPATEAPLFFRMRPSVRRTMASCLLFAAHPLLALAPTEEYVDFDEDDVKQGTIQALFVSPAAEEPKKEQSENLLCGFHPSELIEGINPPGTPLTNDLGIPIVGQTPAVQDDATLSVCPWVRQQQQCGPDSHTLPSADIDFSQDVLHNLEMLREVQTLMQTAQELGSAGHVCEAMDCLELAHDLCPGGWLDHRIEEATAEVFASVYCDTPQEDAAAAPSCKKSAREWEIEHKLAQPVSLHFDAAPLYQVIDDLRAWQGMNIYVDKPALDQQEVSLDQRVSVKLENVSLKSALNLILKSAHLVYVVKDDVVQITTERAARGKRTRITYAVADLLDGATCRPGTPAATAEQAPEQRLIKLITTTIEPREWSESGGAGTIDFHPVSRALVINQTPDIQEQVQDLLESLRRLQSQGEAEERRGDGPSVDALMQQCHAAMDAGQIRKAAELARQAFAVDPEAAAADPLVYKMQLIGDAPAPRADSVSLRPCLPPVDPGTPAALDQLYPEISRPLLAAAAAGEEQEPPADVLKGVAKPFLKTGDLEEVGCGKDGGADAKTPAACPTDDDFGD